MSYASSSVRELGRPACRAVSVLSTSHGSSGVIMRIFASTCAIRLRECTDSGCSAAVSEVEHAGWEALGW